MTPSVWLIGGATASGKSALALGLAEATGGVVVNADSMQIYRGIEILSAAPPPDGRRGVPHLLYGAADPGERWSVGRWLEAALGVLAEEAARPVIFVGGTGLYFRALTRGLAPTPPIRAEVALEARRIADAAGEDGLRTALARLDPESGRAIAPGDRLRLLRALEVILETGRSIEDWRKETRAPLAAGAFREAVVEAPRELLSRRCDARLERMFAEGAIGEVRALLALQLSPDLPVMKALGLREIARHLDGELSREEALREAQQATRRYAKRQMTWFRHQAASWPRLDGGDLEAAARRLRELPGS